MAEEPTESNVKSKSKSKQVESKTKICKFYNQGRCTNKRCRFKHVDVIPQSIPILTQQSKSKSKVKQVPNKISKQTLVPTPNHTQRLTLFKPTPTTITTTIPLTNTYEQEHKQEQQTQHVLLTDIRPNINHFFNQSQMQNQHVLPEKKIQVFIKCDDENDSGTFSIRTGQVKCIELIIHNNFNKTELVNNLERSIVGIIRSYDNKICTINNRINNLRNNINYQISSKQPIPKQNNQVLENSDELGLSDELELSDNMSSQSINYETPQETPSTEWSSQPMCSQHSLDEKEISSNL